MPKLLPSERDNVTTKRKVLAAARVYFRQRKGVSAVFEHGHWWVVIEKGDRSETFAVHDTQNSGVDGFCFEQV